MARHQWLDRTAERRACRVGAEAALAQGAEAAGLLPRLRPFPRADRLADALAENPFVMAPMAGVSDAAYRVMARAGGAAAAYSEMVSVSGIHYGSDRTWELVDPDPAEPDIVVQLFGSDPALFREAAAAVVERLGSRLAWIDINMACPVPKVTRKGEGSALLDEPERAAAIVAACKEAGVPVSAKIRIGRTADRLVGPDFARALEQAGVDEVTVHGRTASQLYRGSSDPDQIARVVEAVSVPVIASGDALGAQAAVDLLRRTGAAGVMCARGTYGDPWIFSDAKRLWEGRRPESHGLHQRLAAFALHVRLLHDTGAHMARARSLAGWYLRGVPNAAAWRERAMHCKTQEDYLALAGAVQDEVDAAIDEGRLNDAGRYLSAAERGLDASRAEGR